MFSKGGLEVTVKVTGSLKQISEHTEIIVNDRT